MGLLGFTYGAHSVRFATLLGRDGASLATKCEEARPR